MEARVLFSAGETRAVISLVDIGANLAHDSFNDDLPQVLERAHMGGVGTIVVTGSDEASARKAQMLTRAHAGLYSTAGLHPHHAGDWTRALGEVFRELAQDEKLVALGECGLDYFRNFSPHDVQRRTFAAQLALAADLKKPLFLHQRDAHQDFSAALREHRAQLAEVVVHCYTDTRAALAEYLALDCHIGITGWICDGRRGAALIESVRDIPDERLLVETDAPYLLPRTAPKPHSRRNEPCQLPWVVRALAAARGQSEEHVANITSENARRFFRLG